MSKFFDSGAFRLVRAKLPRFYEYSKVGCLDTSLDSRISGIVEINYRIGNIIIMNKDLQMSPLQTTFRY